MNSILKRKGTRMLILTIIALILFIAAELLIVKFNGAHIEPPRNIPRIQSFGQGKPLALVVFGDSTAVAQGGRYEKGIAIHMAQLLASKHHSVTLHNYAMSGARTRDVATTQLSQLTHEPDVVLISIGANDVTHFTPRNSVQNDIATTVDALRKKNPAVQIFITGVPAMGSIPRFPQPLRWAAGIPTKRYNAVFAHITKEKDIANIEIAEQVGSTFHNNPGLFAADKFHPNNAGYREWNAAITNTFKRYFRPL